MATYHINGHRYKLEGEPHCRVIPPRDKSVRSPWIVAPISSMKTAQLLGTESPESVALARHADRILDGIKDPSIRAQLGRKSRAMQGCELRFLKDVSAAGTTSDNESYIALSYCWHDESWYHEETVEDQRSDLPIAEDMFNALLAERKSRHEGVWIDQLCINQNDEEEKTIAIGSMDIIYKQARLVVVALEDICVNYADFSVLLSWMDQKPSKDIWDFSEEPHLIDQAKELRKVIFTARWFTRAWCYHELRTSEDQVFLIRIRSTEDSLGGIFRFSSTFLYEMGLIMAYQEAMHPPNIYTDYLTIFQQFRAHKKLSFPPKKIDTEKFTEARDDSDPTKHDQDSEAVATSVPSAVSLNSSEDSIPNMMQTLANVFEHYASREADRLAIALNLSECGLYLKGSTMSMWECCTIFYHVALAAGDPHALTVCGDASNQIAPWMRWPRGSDSRDPDLSSRSKFRLAKVPDFDHKALVLDVAMFGSSKDLHFAESQDEARADCFLKKWESINPVARGQALADTKLSVRQKEHLSRNCARVLACLMACGGDYVVNGCRLLTIDNLAGPLVEIIDLLKGSTLEVEEDGNRNFRLYIHVLFFLRVFTTCVADLSIEDWQPAWIQIGDGQLDRLLLMCPPDSGIHLVIPDLLRDMGFVDLSRFWFMKKISNGEGRDRWAIVGKVKAFGVEDFMEPQYSRLIKKGVEIWA